MTFEFDVYLAHAWEDKPTVRAIVEELRNEGFRVWYDDNELESGRSLREQLDRGMNNSRVGIVVLSKAFFNPAKIWAPAEFDSWLEVGPRSRLITIWLDVAKEDVRSWSPIASTLFARRFGTDEFSAQLSQDVRNKLIDSGSIASHLRSKVEKYINWVQPPEIFHQSIQALDMDQSWLDTEGTYALDQGPVAVRLPDLFERTSDFASTPVLTQGRQVFKQVLGRTEFLQEFAFQIITSEPGYEKCLVMVIVCKKSTALLPIPAPPTPAHLATVFGRIVARGSIAFDAVGWQSVVIIASNVAYMSPDPSFPPPLKEWP
ncbi:toll/interleukin-1 receptor domain-containing protein [Promicromonospora thailandica]|uniref:TIR domain-containing protein n=1 Tax=Promicromonospora thailandica TaxID=765201 RepID=A0A9X2G3H3_9MICO|nr:toll/interleukin-1 receptor domain-containing protein [Promicromonospora thailandica]MCP2264642.1 TIR domain-containing protein [Promicromonospora thailandica]BFF20281.1 hypothetical protein GCM10025730_38020 [Promicromonospora thailandica]